MARLQSSIVGRILPTGLPCGGLARKQAAVQARSRLAQQLTIAPHHSSPRYAGSFVCQGRFDIATPLHHSVVNSTPPRARATIGRTRLDIARRGSPLGCWHRVNLT